ncbi:MAG TPA: LamG domain-containing protein, partial [Draconibacterium sp.]|nr:LamG domain-containing protein [Draconibacterium sp.]
APIITLGRYGITGFYFGIDSKGRLGFHVSDGTSTWFECNSKLNPETKVGLELKKWYHVVGTFSSKNGLAIYINGSLSGTFKENAIPRRIVYSEFDKGFRLGKNRIDLAPTDPIRDWATYPSRYTLDGIVDELKIYEKELSAKDVERLYKSVIPENEPEFSSRKFPTVKSSGRFGANYTRLKFYQEWDALWPAGDQMDVVVQFDEFPTKLMFWRGTRYSPCWVSENGKWMADQSRETGYNWFLSEGKSEYMPTGCVEHMSDTQCRSSRVAIIENNDARIVVNWRYLQMDVKFRQKDLENETGFGQWGNELYYIYPDGMCVRHVLPGYGGWQETIFLNEPGTKPEDNVELEACTLFNMDGQSKTYSWEHGYPKFDLEGANIQLINFKSEFKPFIIFREKGNFKVFNGEVRPEYSHFPWWNHWPVAQISSDGRSVSAPDRASHSSLSWGNPGGEAAIYGMINQSDNKLVVLARSWNYPPEIILNNSDYKSQGYDYKQRAFVLKSENQGNNLDLIFNASEESPLLNPAFVIQNWDGSDLKLIIDNEEIPRGKDFRYGMEYDVEGNISLIIWIKKTITSKTNILLIPIK